MEAAGENSYSSSGYKLVPWLGWDEWEFVRESLFSSSPDSVSSALNRIVAWRSRGCLPVVIDVTASIIEIQQKDPFFRNDQTVVNLHSEEMLAMLYCMAIMRLVNGVVEKTRKQNEVSIADAADIIGIPRMLIDLRHEGSHRDLPSLRLLRIASVKAIDWLNAYYWEPQRERVASEGDGTAMIRKEIKSKLHEFIFHLKAKDSSESPSSLTKGKRSKKQVMKTKKSFIRLYSSFSSEVVSVLLEYVLKSTNFVDAIVVSKHDGPIVNNQQSVSDDDNPIQTVSDDWKVVTLKLAKKEPKLLMDLLESVLDMIETETNKEYELGAHLEYNSDNRQIERLSSLFAWLVCVCKVLKPTRRKYSEGENEDCSADTFAPRATLKSLLHKCLVLLAPGSDHLMGATRNIARMTENKQLIKKLKKLSFMSASTTGVDENPSVVTSEDLLCQEKYLSEAEADLAVLKLRKSKSKVAKRVSERDVGNGSKWVVAKSWNTCPIGVLPCKVGSSGRLLPTLVNFSDIGHDGKVETGPKQGKEPWELKPCGKREAELDIEVLDSDSNVKKMKETVKEQNDHEDDSDISDGGTGKLIIGGVWRKVTENEVVALRSHVRVMAV